ARAMVEVQTRQAERMRDAVETHERRNAENRARSEAKAREIDEKYHALKEKVRARHEKSWNELADRWHEGMGRTRAALDEVAREVDGYGPRWDDPSCADRPFARAVPPVLRFGDVRVDLDQLPQGVPADARLRDGVPPDFTFPALRPFPGLGNLLVITPAEG